MRGASAAATRAPDECASEPNSSAQQGVAERWVVMDWMRLLAALGIVWLHTAGELPHSLGRFAVPFLAASLVFMSVRHCSRRADEAFSFYSWNRFTRLIYPFIAWSIIYGIARQVGSQLTPHVLSVELTWSTLWTGTTHHLWFLPFAFLLSLFTYVVASLARVFPRLVLLVLVAATFGSLLIANPFVGVEGCYTLRLSYDTLPAVMAAMAYAVVWFYLPDWRPKPSHWYLVVAIASTAILSATETGRNTALENLAGFSLMLFSLAQFSPAWGTRAPWPAEMPYGIYLCHILFLEGLEDFQRILEVPDSFAADLIIFVASTVLSVAFVYTALRLRLKVLVGG